MMKKKVKKFLKLLAKDLGQASQDIRDDQLKSNFLAVIKNIPDPELKNELMNNVDGNVVTLIRYISRLSDETVQTDKKASEEADVGDTMQIPFNLYVPNEKIQEQNLSDSVQTVYRCYFSQVFDDEILKKISESLDDQLKEMCSLTLGSSVKTETIMLAFYRKISSAVENVLQEGDNNRQKALQKDIVRYLFFFHHKHEMTHLVTSGERQPKYEDILAALLSLYADLACVNARKLQADGKKTQTQMFSTVIQFLLYKAPSYIMDVFLQMTQITSDDTLFLLPLIRSVLVRAGNSLKCHESYTKYILTVCKICKYCQHDGLEKLKKTALSIHAPKGYIQWIKENNPALLDDLPDNLRHFKGVRITRYLLEEGTEETLEALQSLLTIQDNSGQQSESELLNEYEKVRTDDSDHLFYVDKSADQSICHKFQVRKEDRVPDNDEIEERKLAAMDENSEDEVEIYDQVEHFTSTNVDPNQITSVIENLVGEEDQEPDNDEMLEVLAENDSSEDEIEIYDQTEDYIGTDKNPNQKNEAVKKDILEETKEALSNIGCEKESDVKDIPRKKSKNIILEEESKNVILKEDSCVEYSSPVVKKTPRSKRKSILVEPEMKTIDETSIMGPLKRQTRRSAASALDQTVQSPALLNKSKQTKQIMDVISNSESGMVSLKLRCSPRRKNLGVKDMKDVLETSKLAFDMPGLTIDDIQKSTRKRTISQTSGISHLSLLSEGSVSSNTRSKSNAATPIKNQNTMPGTQTNRRRTIQLSNLSCQQSTNTKKQKIDESPGLTKGDKRMKRRSMIY